MKPITVQQIPDLIAKLSKRGARPFSITLRTSLKLLKKSRINGKANPYPEIFKVSQILAFLNFDYANSVNNQREREGIERDFQSKPNWFNHSKIKAIVVGKKDGCLYLQLKVQQILSVVYVDQAGNEYRGAHFKGLMPTRSFTTRQGVAKPVLTMVPALDSILGFKVDGEAYIVIHDQPARHSFVQYVMQYNLGA